jgi:hypothetical protein
LSVENEFSNNYQIPDIADSVYTATHISVAGNERPVKISSVGQFGFGRRILDYLLFVMRCGTYYKSHFNQFYFILF